jgi:hypothetical protein
MSRQSQTRRTFRMQRNLRTHFEIWQINSGQHAKAASRVLHLAKTPRAQRNPF